MDSTTSSTSTHGVTTTFTEDDKLVSKTFVSSEIPLDAAATSESIKDFLAKPFLVTSSTWNSTSVQGDSLFGTTGFGTDSLLEVSAAWIPKWKGFSMIKATIVYRLQLNANPFQSGKLLMHFLPLVQAFSGLDAPMAKSYQAMHNYDITTKTMQPHVVLDCRETAAIMRIPYVTPASHYPLNFPTGSGTIYPRYERGAIYLSVLSPLRTGAGGEGDVNFALYAHFEDVELCAPFYPEMSGKPARKSKRVKFSTKAISSNDAEAKAMADMPVANALSQAAKIAGYATAIPALTALATPAQWVLDGASGIASFFGWSKPSVGMAPTVVSNQYGRFLATSDGGDTAVPLSLRSCNAVTVLDGKSFTTDDEMSFAWLKKVEALTQTVEWTTSQSAGTLLYGSAVGPRQIKNVSVKTVAPKSIAVATGPPVYYLSNVFRQYRGGLRLCIKIAKTDFHSGRLEIVFAPRSTASIPSLTNSTMSLREIVDIREGNEICLDLPFLVPVPYLDIEQAFGYLSMRVLNELRCPETASQAVQLLMYWSGSDDFELAVPGYSENTLAYPAFSPEMGDEGSDKLVDEVVGSQPVVTETMESASYCVGELFTSVRQLISRNQQIFCTTVPTATDRMAMWPFFTSVAKLTSSGISTPKYGGDMFSYVSPMYVFYRGGMRVTMDTAASVGSLSATLAPSQVRKGRETFATSTSVNGTDKAVTYFASSGISPTGTYLSDSGVGLLSLSLPYYCKTPVSLNVPNVTDAIPNTASGVEYSVPSSAISVEYQSIPVWYRSVAEDFQFTYFVGCPPVPIAQVANAFSASLEEEGDVYLDAEATRRIDV